MVELHGFLIILLMGAMGETRSVDRDEVPAPARAAERLAFACACCARASIARQQRRAQHLGHQLSAARHWPIVRPSQRSFYCLDFVQLLDQLTWSEPAGAGGFDSA